MGPKLDLLDLVVRDMEATLAFYRALGVDIPEEAVWRTATGAHHVDLEMPGGLSLHFDSAALATKYNRGWSEPSGTENDVAVICPAPCVPTGTPQPLYGNVVINVPGLPRSSP